MSAEIFDRWSCGFGGFELEIGWMYFSYSPFSDYALRTSYYTFRLRTDNRDYDTRFVPAKYLQDGTD